MTTPSKSSGLTRREMLKWTGLSAVGMALAACVPPTTPQAASSSEPAVSSVAAPAAETATFAYWFTGGKSWEDFYTTQIFPAFYETNPNITIEHTVLGSWTDLYNKLVTSAAGGVPPELVRQKDFFTPDFAIRGILQPMDDYVATSDHISAAAYEPLAWSNCVWSGSQVAMPLHIFVHYLHMSDELFAGAGMTGDDGAPTAPDNWDEFKETAQALSDPANGVYGTMLRSYGGQEDTVNFYHVNLAMAGGKLIDDEYTAFQFNTQEGLDALNFQVEMIKSGAMLPPGTPTDGVIENNKVGMWFHSALYWPGYLGNNPDLQWHTKVNPVRKTRGAVIRANHQVIFKAATEKEAAWKFLDFHHTTDMDYLYAQNANYVTARLETWKQPLYEGNYLGREGVLYSTEFEQLNESGNQPQPVFPGYQESSFKIGARLMEAYLDEKTPEEALALAEKEANEVLTTTRRLFGL